MTHKQEIPSLNILACPTKISVSPPGLSEKPRSYIRPSSVAGLTLSLFSTTGHTSRGGNRGAVTVTTNTNMLKYFLVR